MNRVLRKLKEVAETVEPVSRARLAAAVLYKNRIVSVGTNQLKTHPSMLQYGKNEGSIYLHAEVDAINKARKLLSDSELKKASIMVVRVKKNGTLAMAKPCAGCSRCIADNHLRETLYTDYKGRLTNVQHA